MNIFRNFLHYTVSIYHTIIRSLCTNDSLISMTFCQLQCHVSRIICHICLKDIIIYITDPRPCFYFQKFLKLCGYLFCCFFYMLIKISLIFLLGKNNKYLIIIRATYDCCTMCFTYLFCCIDIRK